MARGMPGAFPGSMYLQSLLHRFKFKFKFIDDNDSLEEEIICWKTNDGLYSYQKQIQSVTYEVCRFVLLVNSPTLGA